MWFLWGCLIFIVFLWNFHVLFYFYGISKGFLRDFCGKSIYWWDFVGFKQLDMDLDGFQWRLMDSDEILWNKYPDSIFDGTKKLGLHGWLKGILFGIFVEFKQLKKVEPSQWWAICGSFYIFQGGVYPIILYIWFVQTTQLTFATKHLACKIRKQWKLIPT